MQTQKPTEPLSIKETIFNWLRYMYEQKASDLFITAEFPPAIKLDGKLTPISDRPLTAGTCGAIAQAIMTEKQREEFENTKECNFAISLDGVARFRVNAMIQRGAVALVIRIINSVIPKMDDLKLPEVLKKVSMQKRGLVIFVGGTGSGKSTSLAAMIDYRNENSYGHIITIEDPIEFVHPHKNCIVTQREVGVDTDNWFAALKNTLRQAPDVILIGEIRFISQRLVPKPDGKGRVAAVEVLLQSPLISDLILRGEVHGIKDIMKKSTDIGMQTFDQALYELFESGQISYAEAIKNADSANDLRLAIQLKSRRGQNAGIDFELL